ncbi:MAG: phosphoglycerate dehydrogenase [Actinomycetota bacterium]|nr:phosphoglycerate dehydrogenase [Actinomycetota bacterium]
MPGAVPLLYVDRPLPVGVADMVAGRCAFCGPAPEALRRAAGIIAGPIRWDAAGLDAAPLVRVLSRSGIGFDNVDVEAATERGIVVCTAPEAPTVSTAEHTVALILAAAKRLVPNQLRLRAGSGDYVRANDGIELDGRTLGLVGYGRIARRVHRAMAALDMTVIAHDPYVEPGGDAIELVGFDELLARADVISLHAPLGPATRHLVDAAAFSALRPGAVLVNAARGGLVDHDALLGALDTGQVGAAALDVTEPEPLPPDHPLLHRDDVIVTPHIASATDAGLLRLYQHAIDNALAVLAGGRPSSIVNPQVRAGGRPA